MARRDDEADDKKNYLILFSVVLVLPVVLCICSIKFRCRTTPTPEVPTPIVVIESPGSEISIGQNCSNL